MNDKIDNKAKTAEEILNEYMEMHFFRLHEPHRIVVLEAIESYGKQQWDLALDKAIGQFPTGGVYHHDGDTCDLEAGILSLKHTPNE